MFLFFKSFLLFIVALQSSFQESVPLKPAEEYMCKLSLTFKTRSSEPNKVANFNETFAEREKRTSTTPLPYLKINLNLIKLQPEEFRLHVLTKDRIFKNKKITEGEVVELDLGYTDDIKDGISPREYTIILLSKDKKRISRIDIRFEESGDFFVNEEKRGRI
ncbi:hypothetical protein SanaruYs_04710 [Chryseotalea sanaruensis]|uniref:Uncharacterized protein n=1 Tax=Chryseotalea sanaruensis TaxID=2482724 RepID=A0A401U632_9BACT|nr:hypothetical protein [Chryseotalea sanaruensis]GCC50256.1 hypothetical protein SanaruYs_04710 [Chryseotalea sanaruensis]